MDILTGLNAVSTALKITKELRDLDVSLEKAELKAKFAELYTSLADAKMALADAKIHIQEKQLAYNILEKDLDILRNGDFCPKCLEGRLRLISDKAAGGVAGISAGVRHRKYKCIVEACGFVDARVHDPHGVLG